MKKALLVMIVMMFALVIRAKAETPIIAPELMTIPGIVDVSVESAVIGFDKISSLDVAPLAVVKQEREPNKVEKAAVRIESQWRSLAVGIAGRLNVRWDKKAGFQLFPLGEKTCFIRGSKKDLRMVLSESDSEKTKEIFFRIKKEDDHSQFYLGLQKKI